MAFSPTPIDPSRIPEPHFLVHKPFTFCQFRDEPRLQVVYTPDYTGATGGVLDLEELAQLEALIHSITGTLKVDLSTNG